MKAKVKKILGIFKRNKTEFSFAELKWQDKMISRIMSIFLLLLLIFYFVILYSFPEPEISGKLDIAFLLICILIVCLEFDLRNQIEDSQKRHIFYKIQDQDFAGLTIKNEEIIYRLVQLCLEKELIEIEFCHDEYEPEIDILFKDMSAEYDYYSLKEHWLEVFELIEIEEKEEEEET